MGFTRPFRCVLYKQNDETLDHLLLHCPIARECWEKLLYKLDWHTPMMVDIKSWLQSWVTYFPKSVYSSIWCIAPSAVLWEIWKERNKRIFQGGEESNLCLWSRIERYISELVSSATNRVNINKHPYNIWDCKIQAHWPLIKYLPVKGSRKLIRCKRVRRH